MTKYRLEGGLGVYSIVRHRDTEKELSEITIAHFFDPFLAMDYVQYLNTQEEPVKKTKKKNV